MCKELTKVDPTFTRCLFVLESTTNEYAMTANMISAHVPQYVDLFGFFFVDAHTRSPWM